jgi:DNA-binding transcriptional ArsR family regulator
MILMPRGRPKKPRSDRSDRSDRTDWLATLAEPTRLLILRALAAGEMRALEIARVCDDEAPNVVHHLGRLKRAGLVTLRRHGTYVVHALAVGDGLKVTATHLELTHASGIKATLSRL